jgi:chromate transporter
LAGGWLSEGQFLDGFALSGILPAPLNHLRYLLWLQTTGIFLPAFAFALLFHEQLER